MTTRRGLLDTILALPFVRHIPIIGRDPNGIYIKSPPRGHDGDLIELGEDAILVYGAADQKWHMIAMVKDCDCDRTTYYLDGNKVSA